ncbi:MAG: septal ring lytic transglycosylase RlpA family protein [Solirubrobacteraceae bacterium]
MHLLRRDRAIFVAVLWTAFSACAAASWAAPDTGGAVMPELLPVTTGGTGYGDPSVQSLLVAPVAVVGRKVVARGTMPGAARRGIVLQRLDRRRGWRNVARGRVRSTERFELRWRADRSGRVDLRAVLERRARTSAAESAPIASVNVYRPAQATYYGPGFFGRQTACGQTLTPDLQGVAHRRLPCGTLVAVLYAGRETVVPVIDRGPFNGDFSWDLTQATADVLGFSGSGEIGYARVEPPAS